ncbi:MAG: hypothetical protein R3F61_16280 [Myxococcota bacterium]
MSRVKGAKEVFLDGYEAPPSPMKNFVGGGGCGCGCIGMLVVLAAGMGMAAVPLQFFPVEYGGTVGLLSAVGVACGLLLAVLGGAMWVASLFLE